MFVLDMFFLQLGVLALCQKIGKCNVAKHKKCCMTIINRTFGRVCSLQLVNLQV